MNNTGYTYNAIDYRKLYEVCEQDNSYLFIHYK